MKTSELMLGDWVLMNNGPAKVIGLIDGEIHFEDKVGTGVSFAADELPLSQEILEKNGWKWDEGWQVWINEGAFAIENGLDGNRYWTHMFDSPIAPLNGVHDLQHALRLHQIKKEIVI